MSFEYYLQVVAIMSIFFILVMSLLGSFFVVQSRNKVIQILSEANEFYIDRRETDEATISKVVNDYDDWTTKIDGTIEKLSAELVIKDRALSANVMKMIEMQNTIDYMREISSAKELGLKTAKEACDYLNIARG